MTKRRAEEEDTLLCGAPPKRRYGQSLCGGDTRPKGGVSPPSPSPSLALPGSRCRKRPYSTEGPDDREAVFLRREPAASDVVAAESREAHRGRIPSSARDGAKKRPRDDDDDGEENRETFPANDDNSDDVSYNSFQFWRNPLPAVDLALLEGGKCAAAKDPALEAMET
ncbi:hypothetical protein N1851_026260 [Merluccius polli]|uniref:Putative WW-binding domain-containing protein n=1 Tax=Merluccius polli TaxID=89951 RepID=A0AA47MCG6_MERPO|nr:hypothetical protein N1851_026260 [Merluccius polli]